MLSTVIRKMTQVVARDQRLVWIDCEMTGLNHEKQTLVEIATIVTDQDLNVVAEGPDIVINQPESVLRNMEAWPRETFTKNGLLEKIRNSTVSLREAEDMVLEFLCKETEKGKSPLAGNSVHMDRRFISKYMPRLDSHLHYRIVDVSTVKELAARWYPEEFAKAPPKKCTHRALDDIRESIEELRYYRSVIFRQ
ncbi:Exonuclease rnase t and dna polymerase iii [Trichostrongylus colubriformis]|uniref:Probable oligoribonuclease n=1 Tax=Trichostrongylus colubriformis TaxID=6319 RepID=A0AAN8FTP1_TRICO